MFRWKQSLKHWLSVLQIENIELTKENSLPFHISLFILFLLIMLWQMPGTIALRNVLLGFLLLLTINLAFTQRRVIADQLPKLSTCLLIGLSCWMVVVVVGWGVEPALSWRELIGQWLVPCLCAFSGGVLAGSAIRRGERLLLIKTVFAALLLQVFIHDLMNLWAYSVSGEFAFRAAPFLRLAEYLRAMVSEEASVDLFQPGLMDKFSYVNNTLAALLIAEVVQRLIRKTRLLPYSNSFIGLAIIAMLFCSYTVRTRNGNVGLLILVATAGLLVCLKLLPRISRVKVLTGAVALLVILATMGSLFYKSDPRWKTLVETIPIAWDTQTHKAWIKQAPFPRLPNGEEVDGSNYERLAWAKEGMKLVMDQPWGTGFNRNAFGDGIDRKYNLGGSCRGAHSHSGLIDFAIANGLPGLVLWLAFLASLAWAGWRAFSGDQMAMGLILMFLVSGFLGRSIVDSNLRDHILQQFLMLTVIFVVMVRARCSQ